MFNRWSNSSRWGQGKVSDNHQSRICKRHPSRWTAPDLTVLSQVMVSQSNRYQSIDGILVSVRLWDSELYNTCRIIETKIYNQSHTWIPNVGWRSIRTKIRLRQSYRRVQSEKQTTSWKNSQLEHDVSHLRDILKKLFSAGRGRVANSIRVKSAFRLSKVDESGPSRYLEVVWS